MKIAYGTEVEDKDGKYIGQVNHVIRDSWTGRVRKFRVWNAGFEKDMMLSPDDIREIRQDKIVLALSMEDNS
ncbi:MAG: PRC-barrel domain-containing protein [Dehalococcoidaceae bacterium]|nr:PRC-barrel domain-containing protein [Dehalococcoidaceae bacterium]